MVFSKVNVPEGQSGDWSVARFVPEGFSARLHNIQQPTRRLVSGETYTKLADKGSVIMSDTPAEIRDLYPLFGHLHGRMLFNGLGLGVALQGALDKPEVKHVTVVEISKDVITLVAGHYQARFGDRLTIVHADALDWKPPRGVRYDVVWHDIWQDICDENYDTMKSLHRKYGRRCNWQGSWCRYEVKAAVVRDRLRSVAYNRCR